MIVSAGNALLSLLVLLAVGAVVAAAWGGRFRAARALTLARVLLGLILAGCLLGCVLLTIAFVTDAFHLEYVASHSDRALPLGYKISGLWAGQAGSLLVWATLIAVAGLWLAVQIRTWTPAAQAGALATMAVVVGFFAVLMLFVNEANPFSPLMVTDPATGGLVAHTPRDGQGMNPLLQHPAMLAHPPTLFMGYAGLTVPLALLVGGLLAGRLDRQWLCAVRRWTLGSWILLGVGILLGSWWAYVELGWGGYWAWDPVENASLLPWLTGAALLHVIAVVRARRVLKGLAAGLIVVTFLLCIFGTYLTRSGIVPSVHSFGESDLGTFLLAFLLLVGHGAMALLFWRRRLLRPDADRRWDWRAWALAAAACLLTGMAAVTLLGTMTPALTQWLGGERAAVEPSFYNRYALTGLGLPLLALLTVASLVSYGRPAGLSPRRGLHLALGAVAVGAVTAAVLGVGDPLAVVVAGLATAAGVVLVADLVGSVLARRKRTGEHVLRAAMARLGRHGRLHGAQVAHLGVVLAAVGIVGSGLFGQKETVRLAPGGSQRVGEHTLTLRHVRDVRRANYGATEAIVHVRGPDGESTTLRPQQRRYDKTPDMVNQEVALWSTLGGDVYLAIAGGDPAGQFVFLEVYLTPLIAWFWIGGLLLTVGGLGPRLVTVLVHRTSPATAGQRAEAPAPPLAEETEMST
ncbi:MAG: cytochrome c-type biogenesis CcmF C-terminal domain-containing protein [Phycisphaerae bacterium]